jgi:restriction system protein
MNQSEPHSKLLAFAESIEYVQNTQEAMDDPGVSFANHVEGESELFYSKRDWCPFCKVTVSKVHHKREYESWDQDEREAQGFLDNEWHAWQCSSCGWWDLLYDGKRWDEFMGLHIRKVIRNGILKSFNISDAGLPVEILRSEIQKRPDVMYHIHPRKMEELVKSVFSDFYDCEVEHCGGPRDKGIDLLVIDSESPIVVQVKRRSRKNKTESFAIIRDLLGAMGLPSVST